MIELLKLLLLALMLLVGWLLYKYQFQQKQIVEYSLPCSMLFGEWYSEYSQKFKWFNVIRDERVGNYCFKEMLIEVTGREMSAFEIRRTLEREAWKLGVFIKFDVAIKECSDHDLIKIIYVIPEWYNDYRKMIFVKNNIKREQELKKEAIRKPVGGFIKKEK